MAFNQLSSSGSKRKQADPMSEDFSQWPMKHGGLVPTSIPPFVGLNSASYPSGACPVSTYSRPANFPLKTSTAIEEGYCIPTAKRQKIFSGTPKGGSSFPPKLNGLSHPPNLPNPPRRITRPNPYTSDARANWSWLNTRFEDRVDPPLSALRQETGFDFALPKFPSIVTTQAGAEVVRKAITDKKGFARDCTGQILRVVVARDNSVTIVPAHLLVEKSSSYNTNQSEISPEDFWSKAPSGTRDSGRLPLRQAVAIFDFLTAGKYGADFSWGQDAKISSNNPGNPVVPDVNEEPEVISARSGKISLFTAAAENPLLLERQLQPNEVLRETSMLKTDLSDSSLNLNLNHELPITLPKEIDELFDEIDLDELFGTKKRVNSAGSTESIAPARLVLGLSTPQLTDSIAATTVTSPITNTGSQQPSRKPTAKPRKIQRKVQHHEPEVPVDIPDADAFFEFRASMLLSQSLDPVSSSSSPVALLSAMEKTNEALERLSSSELDFDIFPGV